MVIPHNIEKILGVTHTFGWLVGVDDKLMCNFCRTCGAWVTDDEYLTVLFTPSLSQSLIDNVQSQLNVGFTIVNAFTFESYQFKGIYIEHRTLSAEEEKIKSLYMQGITKVLHSMGFRYGDHFKTYSNLDGLAVKMKVNEIYDQTPKQGTGKKIIV